MKLSLDSQSLFLSHQLKYLHLLFQNNIHDYPHLEQLELFIVAYFTDPRSSIVASCEFSNKILFTLCKLAIAMPAHTRSKIITLKISTLFLFSFFTRPCNPPDCFIKLHIFFCNYFPTCSIILFANCRNRSARFPATSTHGRMYPLTTSGGWWI